MSLTTVQPGMLGTPQPYLFKNRLINGAMAIDQRNSGSSFTPTTDGQYTLDRWAARCSQSSKYSVQQVSDAPTGFINSLKITSLSSYSVGASEFFQIGQYIEGLNCYDLMWGTPSAKSITLSFWVKSSLIGTFGGCIFGYQSGIPSYPFSYTINSANTWEYKTLVIPGATSGTSFNTNNSGYCNVLFSIGVGSNISGTANTWNYSTLYRAPTGATSVVGTNGATFQLTGVQFEVGASATDFDYRPHTTELQLCQRYYETFGNGWPVRGETTNSSCVLFGNFKVEKRASPTISVLTTNVRMYEYGVADRDASTVTINSSQMISGGGAVKLSGWSTIGTGTIYAMGYNTSGPTGQPFGASAEL